MYLRFPSSRRSRTNFERAAAVRAQLLVSCSPTTADVPKRFPELGTGTDRRGGAAQRRRTSHIPLGVLTPQEARIHPAAVENTLYEIWCLCGVEFFGVEVRVERGHIEELMALPWLVSVGPVRAWVSLEATLLIPFFATFGTVGRLLRFGGIQEFFRCFSSVAIF